MSRCARCHHDAHADPCGQRTEWRDSETGIRHGGTCVCPGDNPRPPVTRFVITHKPKGTGMRTLTLARQGRNTYDTEATAQEMLDLFNTPNGLARVLTEAELATLEVRPCPCYPGHFDPQTCWFDD